MLYYHLKLRETKRKVANAKYPSDFDSKIWKPNYCYSCYPYALDINVKDPLHSFFYTPGSISFPGFIIDSNEELVQGLENDLDFLGISYREYDNILLDNEGLIAAYIGCGYYKSTRDFHIIRLDSDGLFSYKGNWNGDIIKTEYKIDTLPNWIKCDREYRLVKKIVISK